MPVHRLINQPVHELDEVKLREYINALRTARTAQQTYTKLVKIDAPEKVGRVRKEKSEPVSKLNSVDDLLKDL